MTSPINKVNSFRTVFNQIKAYVKANPDMSKKDCEKISELLRVLKFIVQHDILEQCFSEHAILTSVVADIDTKLYAIEVEREELLQTRNKDTLKKLIALRKTTDDLNSIKRSIKQKDFSFYAQEMAAGLKSSNELIIACATVLGHGKDEYLSMFGRNLVEGSTINEQGINILFNILTTPNVKNRLEAYLNNEMGYTALKQERDDNNRFLEYLLLAKKHESLLREYLTILSHDPTVNNAGYIKAKATLARGELELSDIPTSGLAGILNRKKRELLEFELERAKADVAAYEKDYARAAELKTLLTRLGLGPILDVYFDGKTTPETIEEKVAMYIKSTLNRNFFNITVAKEKIKERNREITGLLSSSIFEIEKEKNALGEEERQYIVLNHDEVVRILDILNSKDKAGLSPLLAAYILKVLSDVKHLSPDDILDICAVNVDTKGLYDMYSKQYEMEARSIQDRLVDIETTERANIGSYH